MVPPRTRTTVYGGTYPAQIWRLVMEAATSGLPPEAFPTPEVDYVAVAIDTSQQPACLPNPYTLPQHIDTVNFIAGTEPTETCTQPDSLQEVPVPSVVGLGRLAATATLERAGFYVRVEAQASTQPRGTVIGQTPTAGTFEKQTGTVVITVAT
jgi:membrane peptidoglycan carboxypeptidase